MSEMPEKTAVVKVYDSPMEMVVESEETSQLTIPVVRHTTTVPTTTREGRMEVGLALSGQCEPAEKWVNREMLVCNVTRFSISFHDEVSGEVIDVIASVLHLKGGERVMFKSEMVSKSLAILCTIEGKWPPWPNGAKCRLERTQTRGGKSFYQLIPLG